jgi:predicted enzyme related to lactoylglutathione lyase
LAGIRFPTEDHHGSLAGASGRKWKIWAANIRPKRRRGAMNTTSIANVKPSIEVITLPVSDVERALRFYVDQVGFTLDVDYSPNDAFRVVQLTPPGSSCSIQIGRGLTDASVGSLRNVYLVVTDLDAARSRLLERGDKVGEIRHKTPIDAWRRSGRIQRH